MAFAPPLYRSPDEARAHIGALGPMARLFALDTEWAHRACAWVCDHRETAAVLAELSRPDLPAVIARDGVRHTWASYSESLRRTILAADARDLIDDLTVPVHIVTGGADTICPPALLDGLDAEESNVTIETWPRLGHDLPLLAPERCLTLLISATTARGRFSPRPTDDSLS